MRKYFYPLIILILSCAAAVALSAKEDPVARYALAVGANYGGPGRDTLRYAITDAGSMLRVMKQMGGVKDSNGLLLADPDIKTIRAAIDTIRDRIYAGKKGDSRAELIFYYSGHSDEEGLLLGREKLGYRELREIIDSVPSDVKIAVLDSCSSGAFTRLKGGTMTSPFMTGQAYNMKGYAFMTSSSADEVSQESERIKGSFFTHYLISGLRGAADMTRDGRVTLNEAYQYAYRETLMRTQKTAGGPQHANYNIQMTGTGDVVLTDIRSNDSLLTLSENIDGKLYINSDPVVIAEITKEKGEPLSLALDEGSYTIVQEKDGQLFEAKIKVSKGQKVALNVSQFVAMKREVAVSRGGESKIPVVFQHVGTYLFPTQINREQKMEYDYVFYLFGCSVDTVNKLSLGLGVAIVNENQRGAAFSAIGNITGQDTHGAVFSAVFNSNGGNMTGFEGTGVANVVMGDMKGVQASGAVNVVRQNCSGAQGSGAVNVVVGDMRGYQAAPVNVVKGKMQGFEAGVVNVTGEQSGFQLGVVNVSSTSHGVQLGVFNYDTESDGYPIGVISIVKKGITSPVSWADETGMVYAGISHGNRHTYNIFFTGYNPATGIAAGGLGFGFRWIFSSAYLATDIYSASVGKNTFKGVNQLSGIRTMAGVTFFERLTIFAGASANCSISYHSQSKDPGAVPHPAYGYYFAKGSTRKVNYQVWPGCFTGLQFNL